MKVDKYFINRNTLIIKPAFHIEYQAVVLKKGKEIKIKQTPLEIIKETCLLYNWSDYDATRKAVISHIGNIYRVPIPFINFSKKELYCFFPTDSPEKDKNIWIAAHHIGELSKNELGRAIIVFRNGEKVTLDVAIERIDKQFKTAIECMHLIRYPVIKNF